jgi:hypothetical protein
VVGFLEEIVNAVVFVDRHEVFLEKDNFKELELFHVDGVHVLLREVVENEDLALGQQGEPRPPLIEAL